MKKIYKFLPIFLSALSGCSLKYGTPSYDEQNVPEFSFDDVKFNRFEDGNISMSLEAAGIEQYKDGKTTCAKDIDFKLIDEEGKISTEGSCSLVYADSEAEKYILYDNIELHTVKDDITVSADTIKWNGKSEQLTSGRNDTVKIKKGNTVMTGSGFSASGVSRTFAFTGVVTGEAYTDDGVGTASENELTKGESVLEPPAQIESSGEENAQ